MASSLLKTTVRRRRQLENCHRNQFSVAAAVSLLVMVLLITQPSSAKKLPFGDMVKIPEPVPLDFPVFHHQNMVNVNHEVSILPGDIKRLLTILPSGLPILTNNRLLYKIGEGDRESHLFVRARSPSHKEENFQFSLKEHKVATKPYHKDVILDGHDTMVDKLHNTVRDSNKVMKDSSPADHENVGNSDLDYQDQEMSEGTVSSEHDQSREKRSLRLPRSPITNRGFLGVFSGLYNCGLDEGRGERPFHMPTGYDGSEVSVNSHVTNSHQQYLQQAQWNTRTTAFPEVVYPLQQSNSLRTRNGRGKVPSQDPVDYRESFGSGEHTHVALGREYDGKNTLHGNLRNYISQINVSQKKTLENKKRDLSRQHVTLGETVDTGTPQRSKVHRSSALEQSNIYNRPILENAVMGLIIGGEEGWDKRDRSHFAQQLGTLSEYELIGIPPHHSFSVGVSEQVLAVSPLVGKSPEYDHVIGSVPPGEAVYGPADGGALVFETDDQPKFWLEGGSGLLHHSVFSRPGDDSGLSPTAEPHLGLRIFKRSAGAGGLRESGVARLVNQMREGAETHLSGPLSKRSPLSTGLVAGIGADADHHQHHDHMAAAAAATGGALHQAHHHDALPPAVVLSSGHHHNGDASHHLVAKSETTLGRAGGASGVRGPNHEDSGALVVLHPPHPLAATHDDGDTIHVIAAVPFAVSHHHELHHEADHVLSKSTTLTLAPHDSDPHVLARTTTVTTVTQHDNAPLLLVHAADAPVVVLHHPAASQSSTSTTVVHKPAVTHNLLRAPLGGFGVGVTFGGAGAGHGFYAAG